MPDYVRRRRDLGQFWGWIKYEPSTYAERRTLLWEGLSQISGVDGSSGMVVGFVASFGGAP